MGCVLESIMQDPYGHDENSNLDSPTDWDLSEGLDPDGPSAEDLDKFGSEVDPCPNCKAVIYDQSELCPNCGWYLGSEPKTMSLWVIFGVFLLIAALFWYIM
jgi:hypothetical protein